jgi:hypothetical protein
MTPKKYVRKNVRSDWLAPLLIAIVLVVISILNAGHAHSDPGVTQDDIAHDAALFCRKLDADPTPQGVLREIDEFDVQQVPQQTALIIVKYALSTICPEHMSDFTKAMNVYDDDGTTGKRKM